jgi:hypothetical protein
MSEPAILVVYRLWSGLPDEAYDRTAVFDSFEETVAALRRELAEGRVCLVEPDAMTRAAYAALEVIPGDGLGPVEVR